MDFIWFSKMNEYQWIGIGCNVPFPQFEWVNWNLNFFFFFNSFVDFYFSNFFWMNHQKFETIDSFWPLPLGDHSDTKVVS